MMAPMELLADVCGSLFSLGPHRLEAAGRKGIPQIVVLRTPGILGTCFWGPRKPLPPLQGDKLFFDHNTLLRVIRRGNEEALESVKTLIEKLNMAKGPTALLIATKVSPPPTEDSAGGADIDEETFQKSSQQMKVIIDMVKKELKPEIKVVELDSEDTSPEFAYEIIRLLDEMTA